MESRARYQIFQKLPGGQPTWVEAAQTLDEAKRRLNELTIMFPSSYFIFDQAEACFIIPHDLDDPLRTHFADGKNLSMVNEGSQIAAGRLRLMHNQLAPALTRCSRDLRYVWVNRHYANWLRKPVDKIVGRPILDVLGKEAFQKLRPHFETVLSGSCVTYQDHVTVEGIGPREISAVYTPARARVGIPDGWIALVQDITARSIEKSMLFS